MTFQLKIFIAVFSLSAVFTQPSFKNVLIEIEGIGKIEISPSHTKPMMEIADLIRAKEYGKAMSSLSKSEFSYKHSWLRGFCYWETGNLEKAISELTDGLTKDSPNRYIIGAILVDLFLSTGKHEQEAKNRIEKMFFTELLMLGDRLCSKRKFDEALTYYTKAFIQFKEWASMPDQCYISRGNCYVKMEKFESALINFKQAKVCNTGILNGRGTGDGAVQVLFINALFDAGFFNMAKERMDYLKCEEDVMLAIDEILNKNKNSDEALEFFSRAIGKFPNNAILYEKRGHTHWRMKKFDEAIEDFMKSKKLNSSLKGSWISLMKLLLLKKDYAQVKRILKDFDQLTQPIKNSELAEVEGIRLQILKAKIDKRINDDTEEEN